MIIPFKISSIFGGLSVCDYFNIAGQFQASIGIDPDMPATDEGDKPSGYIRSTKMVKFSGVNVDATPLFIITNPKTSDIYVVLVSGKVIIYNSLLTTETLLGTTSEGVANGGEYYDNAIYIPGYTDVARIYPMNGSASLVNGYWGTTLAKTALRNVAYPIINGVSMPNHNVHRHTDDKLYICDVLSTNKGCLHYIKTTKTTVEGDTDDSSAESALDFDYGEYPVDIETYQTDLCVALLEGVNTSRMRGKLSFWDTTSSSFTSITSVEAPMEKEIFTALKNVNGTLYVFSGFITGGCRVSKVVSGYALDEVAWLPEQFPPVSKGAVDHIINRFVFGSNTVEPEIAGTVFAIGAKERSLIMGLHNILRCTSTGDNPMVTAVKYLQSDGKITQPIVGWKDDSSLGLDKITTGSGDNIIRLEVIVPESYGKNFKLKKLKIPFVQAMAANMGFTVYIYGDNAVNSRTFIVGNTTRYSGKRQAILEPEIEFENNVFIQIEFTGTALLTIALPILGLLETSEA